MQRLGGVYLHFIMLVHIRADVLFLVQRSAQCSLVTSVPDILIPKIFLQNYSFCIQLIELVDRKYYLQNSTFSYICLV